MAVSRKHAWAVAICATLTMTVSYIDRQTLAVLGPKVSEALGISNTAFGWLTSAFSIAYLFATPLSGWWIDRVGARRGLVASVLLWTAVAALHAVVPGFALLFALRIALGIAEGPSFPGSAQTIQRILPPEERARGFGVLFTGSSIGGMIVPPLASALYAVGGWRIAFLGTAAFGLLWVPLWLYWTRRPGVPEQLDVADPSNTVERLTFRELIRSRRVELARGICAIFAVAPAIGVGLNWGAKYLAHTFGVKQEDVGKYLWVPPLIFDVAAITFGHLASRQHRARGLTQPRLLFAIGALCAMTLVLLPYVDGTWQAIALVSLSMAGGGIVYTLTTADTLARMPAGAVSLAAGTMTCAQSTALIISNPLIGASVDRSGNYDTAALAIGVWVLPGALLWLFWRAPKPDRREDPLA